jgi:hypothetical protein
MNNYQLPVSIFVHKSKILNSAHKIRNAFRRSPDILAMSHEPQLQSPCFVFAKSWCHPKPVEGSL